MRSASLDHKHPPSPRGLGPPRERNPRLVNESRVAWLVQVDASPPSVPLALKIARPEHGSASGVAVGLDLERRNALIRKEAAVREHLRGSASVAPILATGAHAAVDYFATRWLDAKPRSTPGSDAAGKEALGVASALAALHANGVAHRDLEPNHVIVTESAIWLVDFGSAVFLDATVDRHAIERDLFTMGCYLAERLLGVHRFGYHTPHEMSEARAVTKRLPSSPIGSVIARALATWTRATRPYESATELERELRAALSCVDS